MVGCSSVVSVELIYLRQTSTNHVELIGDWIQNVKHIISNIEAIEPILQHNIKQGRNPSHRKKNAKERQFKLSHHKQYKQRKQRVAKC
jgi:hypothetical protein